MKVVFLLLAMLASLIIRLFQLVFLVGKVFFSHNKSARTVFRLVFSAKRTGLLYEREIAFRLLQRFVTTAPTKVANVGRINNVVGKLHIYRYRKCTDVQRTV